MQNGEEERETGEAKEQAEVSSDFCDNISSVKYKSFNVLFNVQRRVGERNTKFVISLPRSRVTTQLKARPFYKFK
jgi:hypothetical protein